jgi:hypothetical protein
MRSVCQQLLCFFKNLFDPFSLVNDHDMKQQLTAAGEATLRLACCLRQAVATPEFRALTHSLPLGCGVAQTLHQMLLSRHSSLLVSAVNGPSY